MFHVTVHRMNRNFSFSSEKLNELTVKMATYMSEDMENWLNLNIYMHK